MCARHNAVEGRTCFGAIFCRSDIRIGRFRTGTRRSSEFGWILILREFERERLDGPEIE